MTRAALLVTGSRALVDSPCEEMARACLRHALDGIDAVIVGDASGPDAWAFALAVASGRIARRYCLDGTVRGAEDEKRRRWIDEATLADTPPARAPLLRNAKMVADLAARAAFPDWNVRYFALVAGWSQTHGTMHTVSLARDAGLLGRVVRFEVDR